MLQISLTQPRWFYGRRLATLTASIDDPRGLRQIVDVIDRDAPVSAETLEKLRTFCGGVDWKEELTNVLKTTFESDSVPAPALNSDPEYDVVWSPSLEAAGRVCGLASNIPSTWQATADALLVSMQSELELQTESHRLATIEGRERSEARTPEQSDAAILALLRKGLTARGVAKRLDVGLGIVRRVSRAAGLHTRNGRPREYSISDREKASNE